MNKSVTKIFTILCGIAVVFAVFFVFNLPQESQKTITQQDIDRLLDEAAGDEAGKEETKKARYEYFFRKLRDPETNAIPRNIRAREIRYAKTLPSAGQVNDQIKAKNPKAKAAPEFQWSLAGPPAVGGRTRAMGIDRRDPNIVLAGGVSGGMWKSTDGGNTWDLKTPDAESYSVTSLAQDPTSPDTWYYTSGEFIGNSASARGAPYFGTGVFRSDDNGETWNKLTSTDDSDTSFNSEYDFISKVVVNPITGSVFIASHGFGIFKSTDGQTFGTTPVVGTRANQYYCDVDVASDGTLAAVISQQSFDQGSQANNPGVFISTNDGDSWTEITPNTFPGQHGRSVLAFAPSNPDILYVFTQKLNDDTFQGISFHKIDLGAGTSDDRSGNLPNFGEPVGGVELQNGYNMVVTVKPDDPDFVLVGATNLFRSRDGFATAPSGNTDAVKDEFWIGGYDEDNDISQYKNDNDGDSQPDQHADQHVIVYDPTNPNRVWSGNDGGVYVTDDVTAGSVSWTDQNEGYIVTQFYASAIPSGGNDNRFMGGTQDNGTPFFDTSTPTPDQTFDISSGDGGYSFFTENYLFVSSQQGRVIRWNENLGSLNFVFPSGVDRDQLLFITPYSVDPNDENIMYYADTDHIWRNTSMDQINGSNSNSDGTTVGWEELNGVSVPSGYNITAISVSNTPANILYYAGSSGDNQPVIRRMDNANSSTSTTNIDLPSNPTLNGAYVNEIAVNPVNGNEALAIISNYNVPSVWHTTNGGSSWQQVEGNLSVQSIRSGTIIPAEGGTVYVLGTSTGVYSTQVLNGSSTQWGQEGVNEVGLSVVEQIVSRQSNGDVAAGTHGRGMFKGSFQGETSFPFISVTPNQAKSEETITITANNFTFSSTPSDNQAIFSATQVKQTNFCQSLTLTGVAGEVLSANANSLEVRVPRGILPDECAVSNTVNVTARVQGQSPDPAPVTFTILPPDDFTLAQNYPNPFNPSTTIPINLARDSRVTLAIYDMLGQKVLEPVFEDEFIAGTYNTSINLANLASGVYIYRLVAEPLSGSGETFVETRKMTLIK